MLVYRLAVNSDAAAEPPYRRLATLLATVLSSGDDPVTVGRAARTSANVVTPGFDGLAARLAAEGFAPELRRRDAGGDIVLHRCPFVEAAEANPAVVCSLHLGLAEAAAADAGLAVAGLSPRPARHAGCRLEVTDTGS
jgi:predicted ArsR family transcriptional regulator